MSEVDCAVAEGNHKEVRVSKRSFKTAKQNRVPDQLASTERGKLFLSILFLRFPDFRLGFKIELVLQVGIFFEHRDPVCVTCVLVNGSDVSMWGCCRVGSGD